MQAMAIDIRAAIAPHPTGKGQWVRGFVEELMRRNLPITLVGDRDLPPAWQSFHARYLRWRSGMRWHIAVAHWLKSMEPRTLWIAPTSFIIPTLVGRAVPYVPIIHDLIAFDDEPHDHKARLIERWTLGRTLTHAAHICTISEATKMAMLQRFSFLSSNSISVIYAGPFEANVPRNHSDMKTILCVGTLCPRKNQSRLIQAFSQLPEELQKTSELVIAGGRGWHDDDIVNVARSTPQVRWLDYIPDAEYQNLLSTCSIFAFPSLKEGFGMPVLDAMQRGIPVLTSDRSSLPEIAGNAALFVNPEDVTSIAQGLERLLTDAQLRQRLEHDGPVQAAQFSWRRTVDLFLNSIDKLAEENAR